MNVDLIAVGKGMPPWVKSGMDGYVQRLTPELSFRLIEIPAVVRGKGMSQKKAIGVEGERMLSKIEKNSCVIALDVQGSQLSTESFAGFLEECRMVFGRLVWLIGGADGLSEACLKRADKTISLSTLTFPHMLVRVVIAEQLYRGVSILRNHPYHRS